MIIFLINYIYLSVGWLGLTGAVVLVTFNGLVTFSGLVPFSGFVIFCGVVGVVGIVITTYWLFFVLLGTEGFVGLVRLLGEDCVVWFVVMVVEVGVVVIVFVNGITT